MGTFVGNYKVWCSAKASHISKENCKKYQMHNSSICFWCGYYDSEILNNSINEKNTAAI
ncbi:hypothetical protein MCHI_000536 [Candidatus Magnetoovum chiemensis]|nr:hypothetical protein MCHI_000536 [Candidatus Magnetoovum chiemensis]